MTLASLQCDCLLLGPSLWAVRNEAAIHAMELAEERGFHVLGRGSSRLGISQGETVVKVAHHIEGLLMNLHEMAVWQTASEERRKHLTPCLSLSPELILTQQRVDLIGPAFTTQGPPFDVPLQNEEDALGRVAAVAEWGDQIYACREALGLWSDPDPEKLRVDNFGLLDDRVVTIDYGDQFAPLFDEWARLLGIENAEGLTWADLAERAGLCSASPCYCGAAFGGRNLPTCLLDGKVADLFTELGLVAPPERTAA